MDDIDPDIIEADRRATASAVLTAPTLTISACVEVSVE